MSSQNRLLSTLLSRSRLTRPLAGLACLALASAASAADRLGVRASESPFTVAGVLGGSEGDAYDEYAFRSDKPALLFVTSASHFYQSAGRGGETGCSEEESADASCEASAAADEGDEHGRALLCLQVLDPLGQVLCWAERPAQPGWQRDPRLACVIPGSVAASATYALRVSYADQNCGDTVYPPPPAPERPDAPPVTTPYLLEGALRAMRDAGALF